MRLSEIDPLEPLKELLESAGLEETIYVGKAPTANLPKSYVTLHLNGAIDTNMSKMGMIRGSVLVDINVKLLSNGQRNKVKHRLIMESFDELFEKNQTVSKDGYSYSLNTRAMVYNGGGIHEGYTTQIMNLNFNKK